MDFKEFQKLFSNSRHCI